MEYRQLDGYEYYKRLMGVSPAGLRSVSLFRQKEAMCRNLRPASIPRESLHFVVDHDHETGEVERCSATSVTPRSD